MRDHGDSEDDLRSSETIGGYFKIKFGRYFKIKIGRYFKINFVPKLEDISKESKFEGILKL